MRSWLLWAALVTSPVPAADAPVTFDWFEYNGRDAMRTQMIPRETYRNPILPGYYPDPSVTEANGRFYLVNSTFAHWPGIPIHESEDLVNWKLIGHALTDPAKYDFDGLGISRGVFAPSIHFHDRMFYIINTLVDAGGNFFVTAKDPAGPWSDPVWLNEIDGIDPSFFFDDDGKAYVLNNGPPEGQPLYDGHRAIWMQEFELSARKLVGPRRVVINGGVDISKKPIWIEGPHLYRVDGWYYLMCAEGGTGPGHSEVIFRSRKVWGPFEPYAGNPILTQRDLPADRAHPVTNAGHADLVRKSDGSWWAVFLASRPYAGDRYNTGRETFLLPVEWKDGWPTILPAGRPIPQLASVQPNRNADPVLPSTPGTMITLSNRDEFDDKQPGPEWLQIHVPKQRWFDTTSKPGALTIRPLDVNLDAKRNASFLARRQEDLKFDAVTALTPPARAGVAAGLAAFQNENYWYFLGTRRGAGGLEVFLERRAGPERQVFQAEPLSPVPSSLKLRISGDGADYSFYYDAGQGWRAVREHDDGSILSTEVAGGFVGTVLGPFARQEKPTDALRLPRFEPAPCEFRSIDGGEPKLGRVDCGWLHVLESRGNPQSRVLELWVAIARAERAVEADPILYIHGGPGIGSVDTHFPAWKSPTWPLFRARRDIVFIDQRGTGRSRPGFCSALNEELNAIEDQDPPATEALRRTIAAFAECRAKLLDEKLDFSAYHGAAMADDAEDLRRALGFPPWNIYGVSHGTWVALEALRRHPSSVRSVILDSPYPPNSPFWAEAYIHPTGKAFEVVDRACRSDGACAAKFPDITSSLAAAVRRLDAAPLPREHGRITGSAFMSALWTMLVRGATAGYVPLVVHHAAVGDDDLTRQVVELYGGSGGFGMYSHGQAMAVDCHDSWAGGSERAIRAAMRRFPYLATQNALPERQDRICSVWQPHRAPMETFAPVRSRTPVLLFAGEFDPATPPEDALQAARFLENATVVDVLGASHAPMHTDRCTRSIGLAFVDDPDGPPSTDCLAARPSFRFATEGLREFLAAKGRP